MIEKCLEQNRTDAIIHRFYPERLSKILEQGRGSGEKVTKQLGRCGDAKTACKCRKTKVLPSDRYWVRESCARATMSPI